MLTETEMTAWLARAAGDDAYRAQARFLDATVRFGWPDGGWVVGFAQGVPGPPRPDTDPTASWDYELVGPAEDWAALAAGTLTLAQVLSGMLGTSRIRGDLVRAGGDTSALSHLLRLLGGDGAAPPRPAGPPAAEWRTGPVGRYVDVGGIRTYYESFGADDAPADVLLLHTAGHDGRQWQRFADRLGERARVVVPDMPGHGKTWPVPGGAAFRTQPELEVFAWAFRAALGWTRPTIVMGCSMGGNLTLALASSYPDEVAAAVAFQGADYTPTQTETTLALLNHPHVNPSHYGLERTRSLIGDRTLAEAAELIEWGTVCFTSAVVQSDLIAYGHDLRERMAAIRCPVLLVRGRQDWLVAEDHVTETAARITNAPQVRVVQPDGIGHYAPAEQPDEMAALALAFLGEVAVLP